MRLTFRNWVDFLGEPWGQVWIWAWKVVLAGLPNPQNSGYFCWVTGKLGLSQQPWWVYYGVPVTRPTYSAMEISQKSKFCLRKEENNIRMVATQDLFCIDVMVSNRTLIYWSMHETSKFWFIDPWRTPPALMQPWVTLLRSIVSFATQYGLCNIPVSVKGTWERACTCVVSVVHEVVYLSRQALARNLYWLLSNLLEWMISTNVA